MVNNSFASVIDGSGPGATPPADDFVERAWPDIVSQRARAQRVAGAVRPSSRDHTRQRGERSRSPARRELRGALSGLTPERSRFCFTHRLFGTISLYQVGDFAIAHMVRHNQQAKRVLGE